MKNYSIEIRINDDDKVYKLNLHLKADDKTKLAAEFQALQELNGALEHDDFMNAKNMIIAKPELIKTIKEVINETEDLNEGQMLMKAPKIIRRFIKVLKS